MKNIFRKIGFSCLVFFLLCSQTFAYIQPEEDYNYFDSTPLYSFTDKIEYYTLSKNSEILVIQVNSKQTSLKKLYVANANGTGLTDVFSDGDWAYKQYGVYLEMKSLTPVISGNGEVLVQGVIPTQQVDKRSDYFFIYYTKIKKGFIVSLKVLYPGCTSARFPKDSSGSHYSVDFNGRKIFAIVKMGTQSDQCNIYDSAIVSMNIDGSNQTVVYGPADYSPIHCRFTWKSYPKSPRNAIVSFSGEKLFFFGSIYENDNASNKDGEIFVMNADGSNIRQLTFSKKLDPKPEQAGPFVINYYGSRLYYQILNNSRYNLMSIGMDGSLPESYFSFNHPILFSISTDGKRIFFSHPEKKDSLVYFDVVTQRFITLLDFTKPAESTNYGLLAKLNHEDWTWTNTSDFSGNMFLCCIDQEWIISGTINSSYLRPRVMNVVFQTGYSVVTVNHQPISLPTTPYMKNNRIMIPASTFCQAFGYPYKWYTKEQVLEIKQFGNIIQIYPLKKSLVMNNKFIKPTLSAESKNNQIFIPGYWARDYFGLALRWDSKFQTLTITR